MLCVQVPGYVLAFDMTAAQLFVTPPPGVSLVSVTSSAPHVLTAKITRAGTANTPMATLAVTPGSTRGRARLVLKFSDGSEHFTHYSVLPPLRDQARSVGHKP